MGEIVSVNQSNIDQAITMAAKVLSEDKVIVFPTRAFYGLGADAFSETAIKKVYGIKRRDHEKPLLILIASIDELYPLVKCVPDCAKDLIDKYWPGKITLVFHASGILPTRLTSGRGKIGIRLVEHPVARGIIMALGKPLTGTSANIAGEPPCSSIAGLNPKIVEQADMILDCGRLEGDMASTVVDVTVTPPVILRAGASGDIHPQHIAINSKAKT
ncbi:MAG: L-threonylcarbamoyladenylate synthase [Pseudomonadota bacterium]